MSLFQAVELFGFATGLVGVWLAIKQHTLCWLIGMLNVLTYCVVFSKVNLYSDMLLQGIYFVILAYGWYHWQTKHKELLPTTTSPMYLLLLLVSAVLFGGAWGAMMQYCFKASNPYIDALAFAVSLVAQALQTHKKIETWWLWGLANTLYIALYIDKQLYLTAVLYSVYLALAVYGYTVWKLKMEHKSSIKNI